MVNEENSIEYWISMIERWIMLFLSSFRKKRGSFLLVERNVKVEVALRLFSTQWIRMKRVKESFLFCICTFDGSFVVNGKVSLSVYVIFLKGIRQARLKRRLHKL